MNFSMKIFIALTMVSSATGQAINIAVNEHEVKPIDINPAGRDCPTGAKKKCTGKWLEPLCICLPIPPPSPPADVEVPVDIKPINPCPPPLQFKWFKCIPPKPPSPPADVEVPVKVAGSLRGTASPDEDEDDNNDSPDEDNNNSNSPDDEDADSNDDKVVSIRVF